MAIQNTNPATKICALLLFLGTGCSSSATKTDDGAVAPPPKTVVINEMFPHGDKMGAPDWVELKNVTTQAIDLTGYHVRDEKLADLQEIPAGTVIPAGGYLIINCVGTPDAGTPVGLEGVVVPFKLSSGSGDQFHLVGPDSVDVDQAEFGPDLPDDKSWGRLPDGLGAMFFNTSPTKGLPNL